MRRVTAAMAFLLLLPVLTGCGAAARSAALASPGATVAPTGPPEPSSAPPTPKATRSPATAPASTPMPTIEPSPSETSAPSSSPSPAVAAPTSSAFWNAVRDGIEHAGPNLAIAVGGPSAGELRFEADASATVIGGTLLFVCVDDRSYDGQSGFSQVEGSWRCGLDALVRGYRTMGQPVDAWSEELPLDRDPHASVTVLPNGDWRWRYRATNPILGAGDIRTTLVYRPSTRRIVTAIRTDPLGTTTWAFTYDAAFPPIVRP